MSSETAPTQDASKPPRPTPWSPETRRWVVIGLVLASAAVVWAIRETLTTLILALLLAYLLNPLVAFLQRRWRISRLLATGLIYLVLIALLIATVVALVPTLFRQLGALAAGFDQILVQISATLGQLPLLDALGIRMDSTTLTDQLRGELASLATAAPRVLVGAALGVLNAVFILVLSFYLLKDIAVIDRHIDIAVPENYREEVHWIKVELAGIWASFLRGQVLLALIIGVVTSITLAILGVPNSLLLGLLAGLLEVVPTLGPIIAAIPGVLVAFFQGSTLWQIDHATFALIVIVAYVLIQQLENHLIVPNVLGSSVNLPPIVILLGALAGASLAGVLGVFLAAPVLATARLVGQFVLRKLLEAGPPEI